MQREDGEAVAVEVKPLMWQKVDETDKPYWFAVNPLITVPSICAYSEAGTIEAEQIYRARILSQITTRPASEIAASVGREALVKVIYDALDFDMTGRGTAVEIADALIAAGMVNRPEAVVRDEAFTYVVDRLKHEAVISPGLTYADAVEIAEYRIAESFRSTTPLRTTPSETAGDKVEALVDEARETVSSMCEGFCDNLPSRDTYYPDMSIDCSVCKLRAAIASIGGQNNG